MRIAVATWSSRRVGGVEDYISILLPAMHRSGVEVMLWHEVDEPSNRDRIDIPEGVPAISAAERGHNAALEDLRRWKPDVIYTQGLLDRELEAKLLAIAPSAFFVHTYAGTCISGGKTFTRPETIPCERQFGWGCLAHYFPHGCGGRSPITMWKQFQRQASQLELLRRYDAIVTHTNHMRDEMMKHGLHAEVVAYPVEAEAFNHEQPKDGIWRLLYAGRMDYLKGGHVLLDALPAVMAGLDRQLTLTLAGDGPDRARWERRARALQESRPDLAIEFVGWVHQAQVATLMRAADLLVVPSVWPEPFGSVGPAAGQNGLPAAGFAVGGIPQWLQDGVNGHLAPANPPTSAGLAQAIVRCLQDSTHYAGLCEGAHKMALRFTMERHLPELLEVLRRTAASPREAR